MKNFSLFFLLPLLPACGTNKKYLKSLPGLTSDMSNYQMLQTLGDTTQLQNSIGKATREARNKEAQRKEKRGFMNMMIIEPAQDPYKFGINHSQGSL